MAAVGEEAELVGGEPRSQAPAAEHQEVARANGVHADAPQILRPPEDAPPPLADQGQRRLRPDSRHPHQELVRGPADLQGELLDVAEGPRGLGVIVQRQVTIRVKGELLEVEPILAEEVFGLIEPNSRIAGVEGSPSIGVPTTGWKALKWAWWRSRWRSSRATSDRISRSFSPAGPTTNCVVVDPRRGASRRRRPAISSLGRRSPLKSLSPASRRT